MMITMDDKVYDAARHERSVPSHKMNQDLLRCRTRGVERNNILHVAAQHGNAGFIKSTLPQLVAFSDGPHRSTSYYTLLCQPNSKGETPLHLAAESGDMATVESLLLAHDHVSFLDENDDQMKPCWREKDHKRGDMPLHRALRYGHEEIAMLLLRKDASLVSFDNNVGESPAYLAATSFCRGFLKMILNPEWEGHAFVSFSGPRGMTAFHPAIKLTKDIMLALITAAGKELLKKQDEDKGMTVLHHAVEESIEVMVETLLEADSSLACVHDKDGMTPLHRASSTGSFGVLRKILDSSSQSILEVTDQGQTALHVAKRDACFVRVCLETTRMKELVNVADSQGNTPLHLVLADASDPNVDVADALLEVDGINWRLENNKGCTPLDLCPSDDKTPHKLKSLTREWRRVKEGLNMDLYKDADKSHHLLNKSWDELLGYRGPYGDTILHIAARDEDMGLIRRALQETEDPRVHDLLISGQNSRGETPLHMAAAARKFKVVEAILNLKPSESDIVRVLRNKKQQQQHSSYDHRDRDRARDHEMDGQLEVNIIDVNDHTEKLCNWEPWRSKSENGDTPAHKALRNGHDRVAKRLLEKDPSLVSYVTNDGESLLYLASLHGCFRTIKVIASMSNDPTVSISTCGPHGQNALHAAAKNAGGRAPEIRDASFVDMLKKNVVALSTLTSMVSHWVGSEVIEKWPELLSKVDNYGKTPLHYAAELGQPKAVSQLLKVDKTAAFRYDNQGYTPLLRAAAKGHGLSTHRILKLCPRCIELPHSTNQKTVLHLAKIPSRLPLMGYFWEYTLTRCLTAHPEMARLINETDTEGNTPLHCAILEADQDKVISLLLTSGIQLGIRNKQDQTPIELCRQLLKKGDKNQHAIWVALENVRRLPKGKNSCIKCLLDNNDLLLRSTDKDLQSLLNNISVAATLLVTLTFAATFALPGGYTQDKLGKAVRIKETCIKLFVASDAVAMILGIGVLLKYTIGIINKRSSLGKLTVECIGLLYCAVLATIVAFISGVYAIVSDEAMWIAITSTVLSIMVFLSCAPSIG